jgi:hypothetical protein
MKTSSNPDGRRVARAGSPSETTANLRAVARRRLLRALGGSGGAVLGTVLTSSWHKPVVEAVLLPAHAQTSETTATNCPVTLTLSGFNDTGSAAYSLSLFVGDTVLAATTFDSTVSAGSVSGSSTFPPGAYVAGVSLESDGIPLYSGIFRAECCDGLYTDSGAVNASVGGGEVLDAQTGLFISDDGECSIISL